MPIFAIIGAILVVLALIGVNVPQLSNLLWLCLFLQLCVGGIASLPWIRRSSPQ